MSVSEQRWRELMLIANPISGKGKGGRYVDAVAEVLGQKAASVLVVRTASKGDAQQAAAEFPGEIDVERARRARENAEKKIEEVDREGKEFLSAEAALHRALLRIRVAARAPRR